MMFLLWMYAMPVAICSSTENTRGCAGGGETPGKGSTQGRSGLAVLLPLSHQTILVGQVGSCVRPGTLK